MESNNEYTRVERPNSTQPHNGGEYAPQMQVKVGLCIFPRRHI